MQINYRQFYETKMCANHEFNLISFNPKQNQTRPESFCINEFDVFDFLVKRLCYHRSFSLRTKHN